MSVCFISEKKRQRFRRHRWPKRSMRITTIFCLITLIRVFDIRAAATSASAIVRRHTFRIESTRMRRLCKSKSVITVNGMIPGPTLDVNVGDSLVITVINRCPYNATIHWHGVRQFCSPWADGPAYVTQCPIKPGASYVYRFSINEKQGTLWWHAHASWLRATVYGAIIIRKPSPFLSPAPPHMELLVILGEWWKRDPEKALKEAIRKGGAPAISDALTINGQPGHHYRCSSKGTYRFRVLYGNTYLVRLVNAAMNTELFFSVASHTLTVINSDASRLKPFTTKTAFIAPGQTLDLLLRADQRRGSYYMASSAYSAPPSVKFNNGTTTAILQYISSPFSFPVFSKPKNPRLPAFNDTATVTKFTSSQKSLFSSDLPEHVDQKLLFTVGLGLLPCRNSRKSKSRCQGPNGTRFAASINNMSFVYPRISILEAYYYGIPGVFRTNLPSVPPVRFDFTGQNIPLHLYRPVRATNVKVINHNASVELVFQGTNIVAGENHPMHLHGYDFYVVGSGFGNFEPTKDPAQFNLVDPPKKNSVSVPAGGWAAIRFKADNPGIWFLHCHLDVHLPWGLATALLVKNGPKPYILRPPPPDLPPC